MTMLGIPANRFSISGYPDTMVSRLVNRQERQIVQSWLTLDDFLAVIRVPLTPPLRRPWCNSKAASDMRRRRRAHRKSDSVCIHPLMSDGHSRISTGALQIGAQGPARVYSRDFGPDTGCNASDIVSTGTRPCWRLTRGPAAPRSDCQSVGAYQRAVTRPCRLWSGSPWPSKLWRRWASRPNWKLMAPPCTTARL